LKKTFHILSTGSWPQTIRQQQDRPLPGEPELQWSEQAFIAIKPMRSPDLQNELKPLVSRELEVIFTSRHAVLALSSLLSAFPGAWTANLLEGATRRTFERLFPAAPYNARGYYAEELAAYITREKTGRSFVFFCGDKRRETLPGLLRHHGLEHREITVYRTVLKPETVGGRFDGIVFFSPSAVESYFKNNRPAPESVLFAIGKTTASAIAAYWAGRVICPAFPDKAEMYHTVKNYFNTLL